MASFSLQQIADAHGYSKIQTWRHISELQEKRKFKKTSVGKFFNSVDARKLSQLLGFEYSELLTKKNPQHEKNS